MTTYLLLMAEADHFRKWEEADDALRAREDRRALQGAVLAHGHEARQSQTHDARVRFFCLSERIYE